MTEVRVCEDWFPDKKGFNGKSGFPMNILLKENLDLLIKNVVKDWDFTILISGGGEVRVGKSILAMQIACYWAYQMLKIHGKKVKYNIEDNFIFDSKKLIKKGNELGLKYPYSPLLYDEAGGDLQGRKVMFFATQDLLDYLRECGQYNMLNILVLPEFFDVPKGIAISRSIFLIDVFYEGEFERGHFHFYGRRQKKFLYIKGKRELNYNAVKWDFDGNFPNFFTVNEKQYRKLKQEALKKREYSSSERPVAMRNVAWFLLNDSFGFPLIDIANKTELMCGVPISPEAVLMAINPLREKYGKKEEEKAEKGQKNDDKGDSSKESLENEPKT